MRNFIFALFVFTLTLTSSAGGVRLFDNSYLPRADMKWGETFKEVVPIKFNSLGGDFSVREISFRIDGVEYRATRERFEYHSEDNYSWFGKVAGSEFLSHFAFYEGEVAGEIYLPTNTPGGFHLSLVSRGGSEYLVKYDTDVIGRGLEKDQISSPATEKEAGRVRHRPIRRGDICGVGDDLTTFVDLMYVYDETSLEWFMNPNRINPAPSLDVAENELRALMLSSVDGIVSTIWNSKAGPYSVNLVAMEKVKYRAAGASGGWMSDDWQFVANDPYVQSLRDQYKADVVGLWVGVTISSQGLAGGGYGSDLGEKAYHVTTVGGGVQVAVHEFGHNLGMGHQPEDWTNPILPFSLGHYVNLHFYTAVATWQNCQNFCDPIPVFSNPNILVDGIPTGIANERENWRMVGIAFPVVSKYRDGTQPKCIAKEGGLFKVQNEK